MRDKEPNDTLMIVNSILVFFYFFVGYFAQRVTLQEVDLHQNAIHLNIPRVLVVSLQV